LQLAGAQLSKNLAAFRADVTTGFGIPDDAVRPPGTLHLTLGVMSLRPEGVGQAVELLETLKPRDILAELRAANGSLASANTTPSSKTNGGLSISLRGLHSMTSASRTSVLYAPPTDAEGILYKFCQQLRQPFSDTGLMADDGRPMLLHATVINTIYVKGRGGGRRKEKLMLDARDLLTKYEDHVWDEDMPISRVAVCRMGAKKLDDGDEVYEVEGEIDL
jgi:activating signal cointegrator complex subunit 1